MQLQTYVILQLLATWRLNSPSILSLLTHLYSQLRVCACFLIILEVTKDKGSAFLENYTHARDLTMWRQECIYSWVSIYKKRHAFFFSKSLPCDIRISTVYEEWFALRHSLLRIWTESNVHLSAMLTVHIHQCMADVYSGVLKVLFFSEHFCHVSALTVPLFVAHWYANVFKALPIYRCKLSKILHPSIFLTSL